MRNFDSTALKRSVVAIGGAALLASSSLGLAHAQTVPSPAVPGTAVSQQSQPGVRVKHHGHRLRKLLRGEMRVAAEFIGVDLKQLRTELKGNSLSDVATAHGVAPAEVARALKADVDAKIDAAVASGRLSADRANKLKQRASVRVDRLMTRTFASTSKTP